jgi:phosphatidylserine decarboxylase
MVPLASRAAAGFLELLPRKRISRALGRLSALTVPAALLRPVISIYARGFGVDLDEAQAPAGGFRSFDEFFTRRLLPGRRPIARDPNAIVAPADGRIADRGPIDPHQRLRIKGADYRVVDLLGATDADRFAGGEFVVVYLSPRDYHRVHAPCGGFVDSITHVPGTLYPVNEFGLSEFGRVFAYNERLAVWFADSLNGAGARRWAVLFVAAIGVGHVTLSVPTPERIETNVESGQGRTVRLDPRPALRAGDELGVFHLGSTVILFFEPGASVPAGPTAGQAVRVGERIGTRVQPDRPSGGR